MAIKTHSYWFFLTNLQSINFSHRMGVPCDMATFDFGQPSSTASLIGTGTPKRLFNFGPSSSSLPRSLRQPPGNTNKALFFQKSRFFFNGPFLRFISQLALIITRVRLRQAAVESHAINRVRFLYISRVLGP